MALIQGFRVQTQHVISWSTHTFIHLWLIQCLPGTPGNLVDKSKFSPRKGSAALRQLKLTHKKGSQSFFFELKCY